MTFFSKLLSIALATTLLAACGGGDGGDDAAQRTANSPPVAEAGDNQTVAENELVTLDGSGSTDGDGDTMSYTWEQIVGSSVALSSTIDATATFMSPAISAQAESLTFRLTVSDGASAASDDVTVVVAKPQAVLPPVADAGSDVTVVGNALVTLDGSASSDPAGKTLSFNWLQSGGTAVTLNDADTASPNFTAPLLPSDEVLSFTLTVSNGDASDNDPVSVTVSASPDSLTPKADAGPDQKVVSGDLVTLNGLASSDPQGKDLTYAWQEIGTSLVTLTGADTASPTFTAPKVSSTTTLVFELTVSNGMYSHADQMVVTLDPPPDTTRPRVRSHTPAADAKGVDRGTRITAVFSEPMRTQTVVAANFKVTAGGKSVEGKVSYDSDTRSATFRPNAALAANRLHTVTLTTGMRDRAGLKLIAKSWSFTTETNSSPTANAGRDSFVSRGDEVKLLGDGSSDAEDPPDALTYKWTQLSGPAVTIQSADSAFASFVAPKQVVSLRFQLEVTDSDGNEAKDNVLVNVLENASRAVFVSPSGVDTNRGTSGSPLRTVAKAIAVASSTVPRGDVYIAKGDYYRSATINVANGVSLYGGFDPVKGWERGNSKPRLYGAATMLSAVRITNATVIDGLTIESRPAQVSPLLAMGSNATAIYTRQSTSALRIANSTLIAAKGGNGSNGRGGVDGEDGRPGVSGYSGDDDTEASNLGGRGGFSSCDRRGGSGGRGGYSNLDGYSGLRGLGGGGLPGGGGSANSSNAGGRSDGSPGLRGAPGTTGVDGRSGNGAGTIDATLHIWRPANGGNGTDGSHGYGGGGGGGGGGQYGFFVIDGTGAGGGGGGGGGCGGRGGAGGYGGGGSFGVFLSASSPTISGNTITTRGGGTGGNGGVGGDGGGGGARGNRGIGSSEVGYGGYGGTGGNGGAGGDGGGGGGGVSYGIYRAEGSTPTLGINRFSVAAGGSGGTGGNAGAQGASGNVK